MKTLLLMFFFWLLALTGNAQFQSEKWTLQTGVAFTDYTYLYQKKFTQPGWAIHCQVHYQVSPKFSVGSTSDWTIVTSAPKEIGTTTYQRKSTIESWMACGNYHYKLTRKWNIFSGLSVGYAKYKGKWMEISDAPSQSLEEDKFYTMAWHVNVITVRYFWGDYIGIYACLGYGYSGIAGIGISGRIKYFGENQHK